MATIVQRRRGTTAQHAAFTGALGEITIDTDKDVAVVHDAVTPGGFPLAGTMFANIFTQPQTIALLAGAPTSNAFQITVDSVSRVAFEKTSFLTLHRQEPDASMAGIDFTKRGTTGNALAALPSGSIIGGINFKGWDGAALSGTQASVRVFTTEAWTPIAHGTQLHFNVTPTGSITTATQAILTGAEFILDVPLNMGTNLINNVVNPVAAQDAATKSYVDAASAAGAPPFTDTTPLVKGSADATKLMRFEVDGFTAATTRVLTPPNADITLAGINIAQTFAEDQTFGKRILLPNTSSATVGGIYFGGTRAITNFGTNNFFAGVSSGNTTLTGTSNTGVGFSVLTSLTTGLSNSAVGEFALSSNTVGVSNSALGVAALFNNLGGSENTAVGNGAMVGNISGDFNTAIGASALEANELSDANTAVGAFALLQATGSSNIGLGYRAGENITVGEFNIVIGFDIDAPDPASNNTLNIGNLLFGTSIDGTGTTMSSGNIGIRTTEPESALDINSVTGNNLQLTYNDSDGAAANKVNFALSSTGDLTVTPSGGDVSLAATVLQITNGTDPAANPTNATKQWAVGGEWQYRSSAASEGAGQTNRVHNRTAQVIGSGTDYTLTMSQARIDFGTTDPEIVLPTAGTYLIFAQVQFISSALSTTDLHAAVIRNSTDAVFVDNSSQVSLGVSFYGLIYLNTIVTITASKTLQLWATNATAARGTVQSTTTNIGYVRLY